MTTDELSMEFRKRFHSAPEHIFFCPGRVNLIGEHIDYNGGQVLPCAISQGTYLAVSRNREMRLRFQSLNFTETADLHLQTSYSKTGPAWYSYPLGIIDRLLQDGHTVSGLDMLFYGNLPVAAGLSSSASIEVITAFALNELYGLEIPAKDIAVLSKEAENSFIGVNCGIMDQFAVAMGKKDNAVLLNCDTLEYEYIPFHTGGCSLVIINTNKNRTLADSKYNERFAECGAALRLLKQELKDVRHLCDISPAVFEMYGELISNPVLEKRALHVISENQRVKDAVIALQTGDMEVFGKLLYASHESLKTNYDVTGKELDAIVDFCRGYSACAGARMTGAGFGGCAIALVHQNKAEEFGIKLTQYYESVTGYKPSLFIVQADDGVRKIIS